MQQPYFEKLCEGYCEIAGIPCPPLKPDSRGMVAFHRTLHGVTFNVMHDPERSERDLLILFELGPLSADDSAARGMMEWLLGANFLAEQVRSPTFGRNPVTGDVTMQYLYPILDATPAGLHELLERGVSMTSRWRSHLAAPARKSQLPPPSLALDFV